MVAAANDMRRQTQGVKRETSSKRRQTADADRERSWTDEIRITAEPIDNQRCKFVVSVPVLAGGVRRFTGADEAKGSPLAEAISPARSRRHRADRFGQYRDRGQTVSGTLAGCGQSIGGAIRSAVASAVAPVTAAPKPPARVNDDALYEQSRKSSKNR